ncbi:Nucleus export protein Brr6 [Cordyceps fumosorosea ARSEF 2679]|uniref:Nucleus export protein Brr6 n=1 Tax=Cordyceps fumosorosea (strain ARSEF 2679) TaxID=1081104 RepID=A0A167N3J8_CORFA|nr:Nucleus export protein Brr6 [Cordyceps fumosorosea ARSEF 2679]OAA55091.1 Nucleus export protein Brr6 [Cordyceps fumosorosea ARSEF 2679]
MNHRSGEGHMEWEYSGIAPCDPSSPFTQVAQRNTGFSGFSSPSKGNGRPNPFASVPSSAKPQPPSVTRFAPHIPPKSAAPPFRNPAFTTPRRPLEETVLSEASGAEDSPAPTEASDMPNDTPDVDHMGDVFMGGVITPTKVSKSARYGRYLREKKHTSGKGEIRNSRDSSRAALPRKRKRHNLDRDVSSVVRYQDNDESEGETDASVWSEGRAQKGQGRRQQRGFLGSIFHMLDEHPNAPENLHRWIQLFINMLVATTVIGVGWSIVSTIRSDIRNANEGARLEILSSIAECTKHWKDNGCETNDRPFFQSQCDKWYDCMVQNPESIMRVKVTAKQIAEIINEFSEAMNFKAWGFFFAVIILCVFGNNLVLGRGSNGGHAAPYNREPVKSANGMGDDSGVMWMPVQTPRMKRHALLEDGSDTDSSLPRATPLMLPHYTPSGRRSPSKGERARSPVKYSRSPIKAL